MLSLDVSTATLVELSLEFSNATAIVTLSSNVFLAVLTRYLIKLFLGERRVCYSRVIVTAASQTQVLMRTPKRTDTDTC